MALTAPERLCDQHGAIKPRGVYLSGPAKTYAIFTSDMTGGRRFVAFEHGGARFNEIILPVDPGLVTGFDVMAYGTDAALIIYETNEYVSYFVYDFVAQGLTVPATVLDRGLTPSAADDGTERLTYVKDNVLKIVSDLVGSPEDMLSSPAHNINGNDVLEQAASVLYYLGAQSSKVEMALPIKSDSNTVFLHNCRNRPEDDGFFWDLSGNGNWLWVSGGTTYKTSEGLKFKLGADVHIDDWSVPVLHMTIESLFIPRLRQSRGYVLAGDMFVYYDRRGRIHWGYEDGTYTHFFDQERLVGVAKGALNYLAITHTWGSETSTKMFLNGIELPGVWRAKGAATPGGADPGLGTMSSAVALAQEDILVQLSVKDVIKTASDILDYAQGKL